MVNPTVRAMWEIVDSLDAHGINYAVMGGLAVRMLAIPRPTNDVDITISIARERLAGLLKDWESECIQVPKTYLTGWVDSVAGMPLIKLKTKIDDEHHVDLDIFLCETDFQRSLLSRRTCVPLDERKLWVVTPEDLVLLKLLANRPRDWIDVADILFVQGALDDQYMRHWANRLEILDRLEKALSTDPYPPSTGN